ncbi:MAG: arsenate reductase ArsC [Planctomycetota bacterium]
MKPLVKILFLCTGNSCRSQMAEGWARRLLGGIVAPFSAGVVAKGLDPRAVAVMAEAGVDISRQASKIIADLPERNFDLVVTVCDNARQVCPLFPGAAKVIHQGFDDPPALAAGAKSEAEALGHYRRVRDEIEAFVRTLTVQMGLNGRMGT